MGKHKDPQKKKDKKEKQAKKKGAQGGGGDGEIDEETALQVAEIEDRLATLSREMKIVDAKVVEYTRDAKRTMLTKQELDPVPKDVVMYRQVGRAFLKSDKATIQGSLQAEVAVKSVEVQQMKNGHAKIEAKVRSEAAGLRELIGVDRMRKLFDKPMQGGIVDDLSKALGEKSEEDDLRPIWGGPPKAKALADIPEEEGDEDAEGADAAEPPKSES